MSSPHAATMLRFGSLSGRLLSRPEYTAGVALVFGASLHPFLPEQAEQRQFDLFIDGPPDSERPTEMARAIPPTGMRLGGTARNPTITTAALRADLALDAAPVQIRITVLRGDVAYAELWVHFAVVLNKALFLMDRVILHAAAVRVHHTVNLFVGEKGSGKSTICLGLARAGGTVLGEDHVVLWRAPDGFRVSGGDERSRVTERTERHFFTEPLAVPARDFAGTMKKEVRLGDFYRSQPYQDFPVRRLLFPQVTGRFELRRVKAQPALLRLMKYTAQFQRFAGGADQERFLDLLAGFIATVPAYEVELSADLSELDRLAERLRDA